MKFHSSIDSLPLWNYNKIRETKDIRFMLHGVNYDHLPLLSKERAAILSEAFLKIERDIIDIFGISEDAELRLRLEQQIAIFSLRFAIDPHDSLSATRLNDAMATLSALNSKEGMKMPVFIALVEKFMGFSIDEKKTSVQKFYSYVEIMKEENERTKRNNENKAA